MHTYHAMMYLYFFIENLMEHWISYKNDMHILKDQKYAHAI